MNIYLCYGSDPVQSKDGQAERVLSAGRHLLKGKLIITLSLVFVRVWQETKSTPDGSNKQKEIL